MNAGNDVVFYGCGEANNKRRRTNNPRYKQLLDDKWVAYKDLGSNNSKRIFVMEQIICPINDEGGRFLSENGHPLTEDEVFEKVSQALRDTRKQKQSESKLRSSCSTKRLDTTNYSKLRN